MIVTTAKKKIINKTYQLWYDKKNFIFQGGQGAGKTYSILAMIIDLALKKKRTIIVASEELTKMRRTVIKDFIRSEEHTSELQSRPHLVCRLLLEKKKKKKKQIKI